MGLSLFGSFYILFVPYWIAHYTAAISQVSNHTSHITDLRLLVTCSLIIKGVTGGLQGYRGIIGVF